MADKEASLLNEIKEEHLDMLIKYALKQADSEGSFGSNDGSESNVTEEIARRTYELALKKYSLQNEQRAKENRKKKCRAVIRTTARVIVCMILFLAVATPIALASIPSLKQYVARMLIDIKEDHTEIQLELTDNDIIPEEWTGSYYPYYLPPTYKLIKVDSFDLMAVYQNAQGNTLYFRESDRNELINVDSEDAEVFFEQINESMALVFKEGDFVRMVWNNNERLFFITGTLSLDEARLMAKSVKRVIR